MFGLKKKLLKNGSVAPKPKPPREMVVIQKEYEQHCLAAGDKQYRIDVMKSELRQINQKLFELNQESFKSAEIDRASKADQLEEKINKTEENINKIQEIIDAKSV